MEVNLFEQLEKDRIDYEPTDFDIVLQEYRKKFGECYPFDITGNYDRDAVIKDIKMRIKSGDKKPIKAYNSNKIY